MNLILTYFNKTVKTIHAPECTAGLLSLGVKEAGPLQLCVSLANSYVEALNTNVSIFGDN